MDRRNFLRTMLGVAAATALPSEVFPFKKIFLPTYPGRLCTPTPINEAMIHALELESFRSSIPDLIYKSTPIYNFIRMHDRANTEWLGLSRSTYPGRLTEAEILAREMASSIAKIEHDLDEGIRLFEAKELTKLPGFTITRIDHEENEIYVETIPKSKS
jgi:hypothetical protein